MLASSSKRLAKNRISLSANYCRTCPTHSLSLAPDAASSSSQQLRSQPWSFQPDTSHTQSRIRSSLALYNADILKAAEDNNAARCFSLAAQMKAEGITPNVETYNALIRAASLEARSIDALALLEDMEHLRIKPNIATFNNILNCFRQKSSPYIWGIMDMMKTRAIQPNGTTYASIIRHFANGENLETALRYYYVMKKEGLALELRAAQSVIALAARQSFPRLALELAVEFEAESVRKLEPEVWVECLISSAKDLWAEGVIHCWQLIVGTFGMNPDEGICLLVLHTAARNGLPDLATEVLRSLQASGVPWAEHHLAPVVEAFCRGNQLHGAFVTLDIMRAKDIEPLRTTVRPIMHILSQDVDAWDAAWSVLEDIKQEESKKVNVFALNAVVEAAIKLGDLQRAVAAYQSYPEFEATANLETFHLLLEGAIGAEQRLLADRFLDEMKEAGISADSSTYQKMISLILKQDDYEDAFSYLEEMKAAGFKPPRSMYESLVERCAQSGDSRYTIALDEMKEQDYKPRVSFVDRVTKRFREAANLGQVEGSAARFLAQS